MKQNVIIAGAGISVDPPSNLPSWREYNKELIVQIKAEALKLCPEAADILACIDVEQNLPVQCISQLIVSQGAGKSYFPLLKLLNGSIPNANHSALTEMARLGKLNAIITTNFDTLIETAFQDEAVPLYTAVQSQNYYEASQISACKLFKIHGSVHDEVSLIDTISQKVVGLSLEKRLVLENIFSSSNIFVIGFSGADLDFDLDYIPLSKAIQRGSQLTWVVHLNAAPNPNVLELQRRYPQNVYIRKMELCEFFEDFGVKYNNEEKNIVPYVTVSESKEKLTQKIKELFSSAHIGTHGCVGYCLTLLDMIGANKEAEKLAKIYEKKLDWSALNVFSLLGVNALASHKLHNKDWQGALRDYYAVIQCLQHINALNCEIQNMTDKFVNLKQKKLQEQEYAHNLVTAYIDIGTVYYYIAIAEQADTLINAKKIFDLAKQLLKCNPNIPCNSLVSFGQARVNYFLDGNFDHYIDTLCISKKYAQKEGRLNTLVEILLEECKIRLQIGEYYIARSLLDSSRNMLKNIGRVVLTQRWKTLDCEYRLRSGEQAAELTEETLKILINGVGERERQAIIWCEARQEKEHLSQLFYLLAEKYMKKGSWRRLLDVAQCGLSTAYTDTQRSEALYFLGCAAMELARYRESEKYFNQIVDMGKGSNDLKLGWAHSELARLLVRRGDISQAMRHFKMCLQVLKDLGNMEQLTQSAANFVAALFRRNLLVQAESAAEQLLTIIDDSNAAAFQEYLDFLRQTYRKQVCDDIQNQPPQAIATQALDLYETGDTEQAWELMRIAIEKYKETEDLDGVGRCENNMGMWSLQGKNYENAVNHLKTALDIKSSLGDIGGEINQIAVLIQVNTIFLKNLDESEKLVRYVEHNQPLYADKKERYMLYYSLAIYKLIIGELASAYTYGEIAKEGLPYIQDNFTDCQNFLSLIINIIEKVLTFENSQNELTEFESNILEIKRLGKIGETEKCLAMANQLKKEWSNDSLKMGILYGTCGNAFLEAGKYDEAIDHYQLAIDKFKIVTEDGAENHILTALNGICIALGYLGKESEAITQLRKVLEQTEMFYSNRCSLTLNLCNRMITLHKDTIECNDSIFTEICNLLNSLSAFSTLSHEEQGAIYSTYGALYMAIDDYTSAKRYYLQAKEEFLIVNSQHLLKVDQMLKILEESDEI